jgi:flagellar motor switch protein FliG
MVTSKDIPLQKKAAIIMISLMPEQAARVYKYLKEDEVEQLTLEIANLEHVKPESAEVVLNEFYELCFAQKVYTEGGLEHAKIILEKAFGNQAATSLIERITKSLNSRAFEFIRKADPKLLTSLIQNEHPQTIALILSYTTESQASAVLSELPKEKQIDVAERIAKMDRTSP